LLEIFPVTNIIYDIPTVGVRETGCF